MVLGYSQKIMSKENQLLLLLMGVVLVGAVAAFPLSYLSTSNGLLGICLLPYAVFIGGSSRFNFYYFLGAVLFGIIAYYFHVKIFYFLSLAFYFIFLLELFLGKANSLILFLIVLLSPVFQQVTVILGFPIRLQLSQWAGEALKIAGMNIQVQGNIMLLDGFDFSVDEACIGLSMLSISLLMGVFIIAFQYRTSKRRLSLKHLSLFFIAVFALTIISNLMRIIILVIFKILPTNPLHEMIGILCLVLYVMLPLYFLGRWMVFRFGKPMDPSFTKVNMPSFAWFSLLATSVLLMIVGFTIPSGIAIADANYAIVKFNNTVPQDIEGGVTKIMSNDLLIYIKPIPTFFSGEHTPLICWKGSGYQFKSIRKERIAGREIFCGVLQKGNESLHTAWWYTNGNINTIDQLTWRTAMMKTQKRFCLVNVTAKNQMELIKKLTIIFTANQLIINTK